MTPCYIGVPFQPSYSLLESCHAIIISSRVSAECAYPSDSMATGFQMTVHQNGGRKLHTNKTTDRQTPASVEVEGSGTYQVTIFAIRGERGILNSNVEYSELLVVDVTRPTATTTTAAVGVGMNLLLRIGN